MSKVCLVLGSVLFVSALFAVEPCSAPALLSISLALMIAFTFTH